MILIRNQYRLILLTLIVTSILAAPIARADGTISGVVTDETTGLGFALCISFFNAQGGFVDQACPPDGVYTSPPLSNGAYYVATNNWSGYYEEVWDNVPCNPMCDVTIGDPVIVNDSSPTGINFALQPGGGSFGGAVVNALTGEGLLGPVLFYDTTGEQIGFGWALPPTGFYVTKGALETGSYYAIAEIDGFIPVLYDGIPCPDPGCDPTTGDFVDVILGLTTFGIDFALLEIMIFSDGFEDGGPGNWSAVVK
jgi:hypothetical protein